MSLKIESHIDYPHFHLHKSIIAGLLVILLLSNIPVCHAQFPIIRNFSSKDYQAGTQNWQVFQSPGGYVFVANTLGLLVYNSLSWDLGQVPNHTAIHCVTADSEGKRIYVGAFGEIGYFMNSVPLSHSVYVSLSEKMPVNERRFNDIWKVCELPDKRIAFQANHHLILYSPKSDKLKYLYISDKINNMSLVNGELFISSEKEIFRLRGNKLNPIAGSQKVAALKIVGAFSSPRHGIVFTTAHNGFYSLKNNTFSPLVIPALSSAIANSDIICCAAKGDLTAVGTISDGLFLLDAGKGRLHHLDRSNGLRNNSVLSILIDKDENLWVALDNGISYIIFDSPFRNIFTEANSIGTGYASQPIGNRLYLGTNQGLYHIALPGNFDHHTFDPVKVNGINGQIWTLMLAGENLLCGADAGAFMIAGDQAFPISGIDAAWGFRSYPGRDDILIASLYDGFAVLKKAGNKWIYSHRIEGINESTINFEIDGNGDLWYSHWLQGVYRFSLSEDLTKATSMDYFNEANQLPSDHSNLVSLIEGNTYISAIDGFYEYAGKGKLKKTEWLCSLFPTDGAATRLIPDPEGNIWGYRPDFLAYAYHDGSHHGAATRQTGFNLRRFFHISTLEHLQMNLGNVSFLQGDLAVMAQDEGFYIVDPFVKNPPAYKVWINFVRKTSGDTNPETEDIFLSRGNNSSFSLESDDASFYIEYSIPEYRDEEATLYSTRIEGYDKDWTAYSHLNYRELTRIPPGDYVFHVRAKDTITDCVSESSIEFHIKPQWYETWWFRILALILAVIILYFAIDGVKRFIVRKLRQKKIREERQRIAREEKERLLEERASAIENIERLKRDIKEKSSQLAGSDIFTQKRADTLRHADESLLDILRNTSPDEPASTILSKIRKVRNSIHIDAAHESSLERIEENFNIVFDDILKKLIDRYPSLTRNDIRLCSYLKLNMSSKEIASLMNLSERSVESNRYRLRKKLGMASGQSFIEFFNSIS